MLTANSSPADVRQAVDKAFTPDVSLTWCPVLNVWMPSTVRDWPIIRQFNNGSHRVTNIDDFTDALLMESLTLEIIGGPNE